MIIAGRDAQTIIEGFNLRHDFEPDKFSTREGKPLSLPTLTRWAREMSMDLTLRNKINYRERSYRRQSPAYKWAKEEILKGSPLEEILIEFNHRHKTDRMFSTVEGLPITINTLRKWEREIKMDEHE